MNISLSLSITLLTIFCFDSENILVSCFTLQCSLRRNPSRSAVDLKNSSVTAVDNTVSNHLVETINICRSHLEYNITLLWPFRNYCHCNHSTPVLGPQFWLIQVHLPESLAFLVGECHSP